MKIALIDADSFIYLIGWNFRDKEDDDPIMDSWEERIPRIIAAVDQQVIQVLQATQATHYIGALGHPEVKCFRQDVAKFKEYKGNRKEEPEIFKRVKPIIKGHLFNHWKFIAVAGLEADDVVSLAGHRYIDWNGDHPEDTAEFTICSPDKDLRQIPGKFYDYKKLDYAEVDEIQATWLFWYQMIVGDSGDGVAGIPKKGDKAAHAALDPLVDLSDYAPRMEAVVRGMYYTHFGAHYGDTIFEENKAVLGMMTTDHLFYEPHFLTETMAGLRDVNEVLQDN